MSALIHLTKKENQNKTTAETLTTKLFPSVGKWHSLPDKCPGSVWLQTCPPWYLRPEKLCTFAAALFTRSQERGPLGEWRKNPAHPNTGFLSTEKDFTFISAPGEIFFSGAQNSGSSLKTTAIMANTFFFFFFNDGKLVKRSADVNHRDCRPHKFEIGLQSLTQNPLYQMHFGIQNICIY